MPAFPANLAAIVAERWSNMVAGDYITPDCPPLEMLKTIFELCYLTASSPEEGRYPQFNILVTPAGADLDATSGMSACTFARSRILSISELRRLAPASDLKKSAIWVTYEDHKAQICGLVDLGTSWYRARLGLAYNYRVPSSLLIQIDRPGRMKVYQGQFHVASIADGELLAPKGIDLNIFLHKPVNEALKTLAESFSVPIHEHPRDYESFWFIAHWNVFASIVNSISHSGHGGMLVIVAHDGSDVKPYLNMKYTTAANMLRDAFVKFINARNRTADLWEEHERNGKELSVEAYKAELACSDATDQLVEAIRFIAQLAGCDGSIVISSDLKLFGFGAEISAELDTNVSVLEVVSEAGREYRKCDVEQFGMRHRSAIKLASKSENCLILAISQDGPISAAWREGEHVFVKKGVSLTNKNMPWA